MENLHKRIGFFLRETSDGKNNSGESRYVFRYFIIDNDYNLHYTIHYSHIQNVVRTSTKFSDLFSMVDTHFKSIPFTDIKIGDIKEYPKPEFLPFLNKKYFDVEVAFPDTNLETSANRNTGNSSGNTTKVNTSRQIKGGDFKKSGSVVTANQQNKITEANRLNDKLAALKNNFEKILQIQEKIEEEESQTTEIKESIEVIEQVEEETEDTTNNEENTEQDVEEVGQDESTPKEIEENSEKKVEDESKNIVNTKSGGKYSGDLQDGLAHGKGKEFFKSGISYIGQFKNGKRHGSGYFMDQDKSMNYVESIDGKIVGI